MGDQMISSLFKRLFGQHIQPAPGGSTDRKEDLSFYSLVGTTFESNVARVEKWAAWHKLEPAYFTSYKTISNSKYYLFPREFIFDLDDKYDEYHDCMPSYDRSKRVFIKIDPGSEKIFYMTGLDPIIPRTQVPVRLDPGQSLHVLDDSLIGIERLRITEAFRAYEAYENIKDIMAAWFARHFRSEGWPYYGTECAMQVLARVANETSSTLHSSDGTLLDITDQQPGKV